MPAPRTFRLPTILHAGLLPEEDWPELGELRAEHERLARAAIATQKRARSIAGQRHEARANDLKAREAALEVGVAPPPLTKTDAEWDAELAEAKRDVEAAHTVLERFQIRMVEIVHEKEQEWLADLDRREQTARARQDEARRILAEAEAEVEGVSRRRVWVTFVADGDVIVADHDRKFETKETSNAGS